MKRLLLSLTAIAVAFLLVQCDSDNPVDSGDDNGNGNHVVTGADSIATAWLTALIDTLTDLDDADNDRVRNTHFDVHRAGFQQAIDLEVANPIANLGMSLVELLEVNYNDRLWAFIDSLDSFSDRVWWLPYIGLPVAPSSDGRREVVGNQFKLMVSIPMYTVARATAIPPNISVNEFQVLLGDVIIPKLDNAIARINTAASASEAIRLCHEGDGMSECVKINRGEILVFAASLYALRSAMYCATAYDLDLYGPDGSYQWLDDMADLFDELLVRLFCCDYELIELGAVDDLRKRCSNSFEAEVESTLVRVAHHNLENRSDYLSLRSGGQVLANSHADMVQALDVLEAATAFIRSHPGDEENVIKLADLTDLDQEMRDADEANFSREWTKIEDLTDFIGRLLSGPVQFQERIGPNHVLYSWTMDLSRLFLSPVNDWSSLLPYHTWNLPAGSWIVWTVDQDSFDNGGGYYADNLWDGEICNYIEFPNIGTVYVEYRSGDFDTDGVFFLLDGPTGNVIDQSTTFPYFPDYTFNGVFPQMNRSAWETVYQILR
jgi:hypothetical protein